MRKALLLTPELAEELRERAHQERRSESDIAREALDAFFHPADRE